MYELTERVFLALASTVVAITAVPTEALVAALSPRIKVLGHVYVGYWFPDGSAPTVEYLPGKTYTAVPATGEALPPDQIDRDWADMLVVQGDAEFV